MARAQAGSALLKATTIATKPSRKPTPTPPNTTAATQWPLYSAYPPGTDWTFSQAVPTSQQPSKGYDVTVSRLNPARQQALANMANSQLLDGPGGYSYLLFVQNFNIDMSLAGSTAQAQYTRDFYARNFVQPAVIVTGQSPSQEDYGLLCEFIHSCQHKAVANGYQNLTQLFIAGRNKADGFSGRGVDGSRTSGTRVVISEPNNLMSGRTSDPSTAPAGTYYSQMIHGAHQPFMAKGYISSMPRIHQQFQYAVQWTMIFMIAAILDGPFNDLGQAQSLPNTAPVTWLNMLQDIQSTGVVSSNTPGLIKQNQQIVRAASTTSINPLTPSFSTTGQGSGGGNTSTGSWSTALLTWYDPALGGTNSATGAADPTADMANGQPYNASANTCAADPKYAFGTQIEFQYNGQTVTCEVTDRGGAITGSHFDLSRGAANTLGMLSAGTVNAQFQVVSDTDNQSLPGHQ